MGQPAECATYFEYYPVSGAMISGAAESTDEKVQNVHAVRADVESDHKDAVAAVEGELRAPAAAMTQQCVALASEVNQQATYAAGGLHMFAGAVDDYNHNRAGDPRSVTHLNAEYSRQVQSGFGAGTSPYFPLGSTGQERNDIQSEWQSAVDTNRANVMAELRAEYERSGELLDREAERVARLLDGGITTANLKEMYAAGGLPSNVHLIFPGIDFTDVELERLPYDLRNLSVEELKELRKDVVMSSIKAFIDAEVDILSWELEGRAEATYEVLGDDRVTMSLKLEAGLGREIEIGGAEVEASAGGTTELKLEFASVEEAEAFLAGLDDAAFDLGLTDAGNVPAAVAANVASYVTQQKIIDARIGAYGQVQAEFDRPGMDIEGTARLDGYYDLADGEKGLKGTFLVDFGIGDEEDPYANTTGEVSAEVKWDDANNFSEAELKAVVTGSVAAEKLGVDVPGLSTGGSTEVAFKLTRDNPYLDDIGDAVQSGDMATALDLAKSHGQIVVKQSTINTIADGAEDLSIFGQGVEVEYGATHEQAFNVWLKPENVDAYIPVG